MTDGSSLFRGWLTSREKALVSALMAMYRTWVLDDAGRLDAMAQTEKCLRDCCGHDGFEMWKEAVTKRLFKEAYNDERYNNREIFKPVRDPEADGPDYGSRGGEGDTGGTSVDGGGEEVSEGPARSS